MAEKKEIFQISRDLRKRHKLTQSQLAQLADVSLPALQRFEAGSPTTQMDTVSKILNALGWELTVVPSNVGAVDE